MLIRVTPLSPRVGQLLSAGSGDAERRLADALAIRDRLATGWCPGHADLQASPIMQGWRFVVIPGGVALIGHVTGHPQIRDDRVAVTSLVVAIDGRFAGWARTCSRYYQLGRPAAAALAS